MNNLNEFLEKTAPFSDAGVQNNAIKALTEILLEKGYEKAINHTLVNLLKTMMNEKMSDDIPYFCKVRENCAIHGIDLFLDLLRPHLSSENSLNFRTFCRFFYAFGKSGNYFDTLLDFQEDYDHGIAPKPTLRNQAYVVQRLGVSLFDCANTLPINLESIKAIAQITISAFDFSN